MMMTQLDLRKQWKHLYVPSARKVELVAVPEFKFVMIDGRIEPGEAPGTSPGFGAAMAARARSASPVVSAARPSATARRARLPNSRTFS